MLDFANKQNNNDLIPLFSIRKFYIVFKKCFDFLQCLPGLNSVVKCALGGFKGRPGIKTPKLQ